MKEQQLKEWLEKQENHFEEEYKRTKNIIDELKRDLFKQIKGYLERNDWDKTNIWLKDKYNTFGEEKRLSNIIKAGYKQVIDKMWSLSKQNDGQTKRRIQDNNIGQSEEKN